MLVGQTARRVAVLGGLRIPFARAHGAYASATNADMLTAVLRGLVERFGLRGQRLGEVAGGAVIKHSRDFNLTRECVLSSGLDPQTPGLDLQRACGTSLEAAIAVANRIALGQIDAGIAAGVDSISDTPVSRSMIAGILLLGLMRRKSGANCSFLPMLMPWTSNGSPNSSRAMEILRPLGVAKVYRSIMPFRSTPGLRVRAAL